MHVLERILYLVLKYLIQYNIHKEGISVFGCGGKCLSGVCLQVSMLLVSRSQLSQSQLSPQDVMVSDAPYLSYVLKHHGLSCPRSQLSPPDVTVSAVIRGISKTRGELRPSHRHLQKRERKLSTGPGLMMRSITLRHRLNDL